LSAQRGELARTGIARSREQPHKYCSDASRRGVFWLVGANAKLHPPASEARTEGLPFAHFWKPHETGAKYKFYAVPFINDIDNFANEQSFDLNTFVVQKSTTYINTNIIIKI